MANAFVARKPWTTALINLIFSPIVGMLYLSKVKLALFYLAAQIILMALPFIAAHFELIHTDPRVSAWHLLYGLQAIGTVHGYFVAKRQSMDSLKWYSRWYSIILLVGVLPISFAIVFRLFFYEPFSIPASSESMEPTLMLGDHLFVDKRAYDADHLPQRGDVIVFYAGVENGPGVAYVKRVIGVPGDRIEIQNGQLTVNGAVFQDGITAIRDKSAFPHQVGNDQYFVVGDNESKSIDSRNGRGDIPREAIVGKAAIVFWNSKTYKILYRPIK